MRDYNSILEANKLSVIDNNNNNGSFEMYKKYTLPKNCEGLFIKPKNTKKVILEVFGTWHIDTTDVLEEIAGFQLVGAYNLNKSKSKNQLMYRKMYVVYNPKTEKVMYRNTISIHEILRYIIIADVDGEEWAKFYLKEVKLK